MECEACLPSLSPDRRLTVTWNRMKKTSFDPQIPGFPASGAESGFSLWSTCCSRITASRERMLLTAYRSLDPAHLYLNRDSRLECVLSCVSLSVLKSSSQDHQGCGSLQTSRAGASRRRSRGRHPGPAPISSSLVFSASFYLHLRLSASPSSCDTSPALSQKGPSLLTLRRIPRSWSFIAAGSLSSALTRQDLELSPSEAPL